MTLKGSLFTYDKTTTHILKILLTGKNIAHNDVPLWRTFELHLKEARLSGLPLDKIIPWSGREASPSRTARRFPNLAEHEGSPISLVLVGLRSDPVVTKLLTRLIALLSSTTSSC